MNEFIYLIVSCDLYSSTPIKDNIVMYNNIDDAKHEMELLNLKELDESKQPSHYIEVFKIGEYNIYDIIEFHNIYKNITSIVDRQCAIKKRLLELTNTSQTEIEIILNNLRNNTEVNSYKLYLEKINLIKNQLEKEKKQIKQEINNAFSNKHYVKELLNNITRL